jgi:hypothetical protein
MYVCNSAFLCIQRWRATLFQVATKKKSFLSKCFPFIYFFLAIATTNAVIAGLIVFEAFKILEDKWEDCRHVN